MKLQEKKNKAISQKTKFSQNVNNLNYCNKDINNYGSNYFNIAKQGKAKEKRSLSQAANINNDQIKNNNNQENLDKLFKKRLEEYKLSKTIHINEEEQQNQYKRKRNKSPNDFFSSMIHTYNNSFITNNNSESINEHSSNNISESNSHIVKCSSNEFIN